MPSFYPPTVPHYASNSNFGHGDGYKNACYQDLSDNTGYADFGVSRSQQGPPILPDPYDRFAKLPSVVAPGTMYGQPFVPSQHHDYQPSAPRASDEAEMLHRAQQEQAAVFYQNIPAPVIKDDKAAVGGVSATLDYDMDKMTDFVTETAFGVYELCASRICIADIDLLRSVRSNVSIPPAFRKWVLDVLHATRLPAATIMLSLAYLAQRIREQSANNAFDRSEGGLYRSLTVALILGSKFLDDNTFQNKSWAEVSRIEVADLNKTERDWLMAIGHRLHQPTDRFDGYDSCNKLWKDFKARGSSAALNLKPIDTSVRSQLSRQASPSVFQQPYIKPAAFNTPVYPPYDPWHNSHSASPASAQTSGPQTPDYYGGVLGWGPTPDVYGRDYPCYNDPFAPYPTSRDRYQTSHQYYGGYGSTYMPGPNYWNCHGSACQCGNCRQTNFVPRYGPAAAG